MYTWKSWWQAAAIFLRHPVLLGCCRHGVLYSMAMPESTQSFYNLFRGVLVSPVGSYFIGGWIILLYGWLEHMLPTVGSLPTATRRGFAFITAVVPPFLAFACCKLVCVGFAKHGEDGNEQKPALLL